MVAKKLKQVAIFLVVVGLVYGLLSHHIIFYGRHVKVLKKAELTLDKSFFNARPTEFRTPELILRDTVLREAGVADVLVEFGIITEDERIELEDKIDSEDLEGHNGYIGVPEVI